MTSVAWLAATGADESEPSLGLTFAAVAGLWAGLLWATVHAARRKGSGRLADDFGLRIGRRDIGIGVGAALLSQLVVIPLLYLPFDVDDLGRENDRLVDNTHGIGLVVLYLLLAVGAPLVEELFFRGFLQRALVRRLGPVVGIGITAVLFGLTHFDLTALLGLTAFGVVLGVLAHRRGSLGAPIVAHVVFNAVAVAFYLAG